METNETKMQTLTYIFTFVSFAFTLLIAIFGALSGSNAGGIFQNSVGNISDKYSVELTPSGYVFITIWPINFLWTIVGKIYLLISLFLSTDKSPVKLGLTPLAYFIFDTCAFAATCGWYFAFDSESLGWSYAILLFVVIMIYIAIGITLKNVEDNAAEVEKNNKAVPWLVRILLQNGLCTFATWVTCASMLSFTILLVYVDSPDQEIATLRGNISNADATAVGAGLLLGLVLTFFVLQNFVLEKYLRYVFTVYPVLIFAFSGIIAKQLENNGSQQNLIFASVNMSICLLLFLVSIALFSYRWHHSCAAVHEKTVKEELSQDLA